MSIKDTVLQIAFDAAKAEIAEIQRDIEFAIDGRHSAEAIVALTRVVAGLINSAEPYARDEMMRRVSTAIAAGVRK